MKVELITKTKNNLEKDFFKLMNNSVLRTSMENVRKDTNIKLVPTVRGRSHIVFKPNYHTTK